MARRFKEEFYCTECHMYFLTYLRENMHGTYTIECPNPKCKHHHYRKIKEGVCTQERHNNEYEKGMSELIMGLPSTLRDVPWHNDPDFLRQRMMAVPGGLSGANNA